MIDFVLHFDKHLIEFVAAYGAWVYGILFAIVFAETGFVVTPFLPGDSLLFAAGALAATGGGLNAGSLFALLALPPSPATRSTTPSGAASGRACSSRPTPSTLARLMNREYLERAHAFFEQYGGKAVMLGRFVPIVRTFVPFVAGAAQMTPASFVALQRRRRGRPGSACACWRRLLFGNVPIIKNNFSLVTIGIVVVSLLPVIVEFLKHRRK